MIEEELITNNTEELKNKESAEVVETEVVESKKPEDENKPKGKKKKSKVRSIIEWVLTGIFAVLFVIVGIGQIDGMIHKKDHYNQQIRLGFGSFLVLTDSMKEYPKNSAIITYLEKADIVYERWLKNQEYNADKEDGKKKEIDVTFMGINKYSYFIPNDTHPELTEPAYPKEAVPVTHRIRHIYRVEEIADEEIRNKIDGKYVFIASGTNTGGELAKERQFQAFTEKELLGTVKVGSTTLGWGFRIISSPIGLLIFLLIPALYLIITSSLDILKALKTSEEKAAPTGVDTETKKLSSLDELSEEDRKRLKEEMLEEMMKGKDKK